MVKERTFLFFLMKRQHQHAGRNKFNFYMVIDQLNYQQPIALTVRLVMTNLSLIGGKRTKKHGCTSFLSNNWLQPVLSESNSSSKGSSLNRRSIWHPNLIAPSLYRKEFLLFRNLLIINCILEQRDEEGGFCFYSLMVEIIWFEHWTELWFSFQFRSIQRGHLEKSIHKPNRTISWPSILLRSYFFRRRSNPPRSRTFLFAFTCFFDVKGVVQKVFQS